MSTGVSTTAQKTTLTHNGQDSLSFDEGGILDGAGLAFKGLINGLTLSNNVTDANNDIDIAVGGCRDEANTRFLNLTSVLTKQLDATWAEGNNVGGLFSGTKAISTWYHVFIVRRDSDGSIDIGFDTDISAVNRPSGWNSYRRIGSIFTDGSGNILGFTQHGNLFEFDSWIQEYSAAPTTRTLITLTTPPNVIAKVLAVIHDDTNGSAAGWVKHTGATDVAPDTSNSQAIWNGGGDGSGSAEVNVLTDSSSQVAVRTVSATNFYITTIGWIDNRGTE